MLTLFIHATNYMYTEKKVCNLAHPEYYIGEFKD